MTNFKKHKALTIAKYLLSLQDDDAGDAVSNLKLQKLLYYSQGYWIGLHGVEHPLFHEDIYAWKHGPVVKSVYNHYSDFGREALPDEKMPTSMTSYTIDFLNTIYREYGRFSAWALREMTHREAPWLDNYEADTRNIVISHNDLHKFFQKKISRG